MSRSGYSDDNDSDIPLELYRQAVHRATTGYRGQHLLRKLRNALDAMPSKRLIAGNIKDKAGEVCALGALDSTAPEYDAEDYDDFDHPRKLADHFNIAPALASEIVYMNDEYAEWLLREETPEQRWTRMRAWVNEQIMPEQPVTADAVDPSVGTQERRPRAPEKIPPAASPRVHHGAHDTDRSDRADRADRADK